LFNIKINTSYVLFFMLYPSILESMYTRSHS